MANKATLKPIDSHERAVELGRRGGIASGKARARKASLRELLLLELDRPYKCRAYEDEDYAGITKAQRIVKGLVECACMNSNTKAQALLFKLLDGGNQTDADVDQDADEFEQASVEGNA